MRALLTLTLVLGLVAIVATPARAQDAEALRHEMEQMRKQFEAMQEQYKKTMENMADRIQRLETQPQPAAAPTTPAAPDRQNGLVQAAPGSQPYTGPSPLDLVRPREPFALYERRGAGQLLFDMGVTGDFVGNLTQRNVEKNQGGSFSGLENLFFPREVELSFFGQIDPYARAEVRVETGQESRGGELTVSLAEANLTLMTLPFGTQLKMGRVRNRFGLLNELHSHDRPFTDDPNVLVQFFGREGLRESGFEATWVPPLPFYLQILGGIFNGENQVAFGRDTLRHPLATGRIRTFFDLGDLGAIQLGSSIANGDTPEQKPNTIIGFDMKYKYTPSGWPRALLSAYGEYLISLRDVVVNDSSAEAVIDQTRHRNRQGFYIGADVRPFAHGELSKWLLGFRYDWTQYPVNPGHEWAVGPFIAYYPSEFLRFRLGYKHTERSHCCGYLNFADNGGSARKVDELFLQATFILGAHPTHPF
jgi:hypothetical protein